MIEVERYGPGLKDQWNGLVANAKNGLFMFYRDYMEYHADRFSDHSLVFFEKNRPLALLPAAEHGDEIFSHSGLTFGGLITDKRMKAAKMLAVVALLKDYLADKKFKRLIYKAIPHIYHHIPAEEDIYALYAHGGRLLKAEPGCVFSPKFTGHTERQTCIAQSRREDVLVEESDDLAGFMALEAEVLAARYGASPVHSVSEMRLLKDRFPENIRLLVAARRQELLAGVIAYEYEAVIHTQYMAASQAGRELRALGLILEHLKRRALRHGQCLSLGISSERDGRYLNEGLMRFKEFFGARALVHQTWELPF